MDWFAILTGNVVMTDSPNTVINIKNVEQTSNCTVCTNISGCSSETSFKLPASISVDFTCLQPQMVFTVEISREIVCTDLSCQGGVVPSDSSIYPEFNRTFNWDVKAQSGKAFQVDFLGSGMRQILSSETCPDQQTYTIVIYQRSGRVTIGTFCKDGLIRSVRLLYKGRLSLKLPGQAPMDPSAFDITVGPDIKGLAEVAVQFPLGSSNVTLFSPNFPLGFPSNDLATWSFSVPPKHNFTVVFLGSTAPQCQKKSVEVQYSGQNLGLSTSLSDPQPALRQGDFKMSLVNCEVNGGSGLSLNFAVSVSRRSSPVPCLVDLQQEKDLTLYIKKKDSTYSPCEMKVDSIIQDGITMQSGTQFNLSFQDCGSEDIMLTAIKSIDLRVCSGQKSCPADEIPLTVPTLDQCLPVPLQTITWNLQSLQGGTIELRPPAGGLKQSLAGQECGNRLFLTVRDGGGVPLGTFCPRGPLQGIKMPANASIVTTGAGSLGLSSTKESLLNVSFSQEITDAHVIAVVPELDSPAWLVTPDWPAGMQPNALMSWLVSPPPEHQVELELVNISLPQCSLGKAVITAQVLGLKEQELNQETHRLTAMETFYLNATNCSPSRGDFSMQAKVTVQRKKTLDLTIILSVVGAVLLLSVLVVVAVCVMKRRKKKSINNPNGNMFTPGTVFHGGHDVNDSHMFDSMKGSYHNLPAQPSSSQSPEPAMETFQPFLDPSQAAKPGRPRTPILRQDSLAYTDPRMMDNELNTFKSDGDMGPFSCSLMELEREPEAYEEEETDSGAEFD
ncbi:CUB domain-containing protein 1-like isoform X2 [Paramormyrops kingsleyae]|uniref:CUB domain-containing protein 1-like isoform X2 n=1 Tax=Paramormyrops kingsleyae TaxID=1676925 RepID=UPI003B97C38E